MGTLDEQQADSTDQPGQREPSSSDERHRAGPGERLTVEQTDKQDELDSDATTDDRAEAGETLQKFVHRVAWSASVYF